MKLYKTYDQNAVGNPDSKTVWTTSQGDASKARTAMQAKLKEADQPHKGVMIDAVEIDTRKDGLVAFLNSL